MLKTIEIDGRRYRWADILKLRRDQQKAARQHQPTLIELRDDSRQPSQKTADGRFSEPLLFND
jgi:hypothetical protein